MTPSPDDQAVIDQLKTVIEGLRLTWKSCLTPTGRRKFGPKFYAITRCDDDGLIGMTSAKQSKGKRWACKTCLGFAAPIWSDTDDCPSVDEALHEYTEWAMGLGKGSELRKQRMRMKRHYRLNGTSGGRYRRGD